MKINTVFCFLILLYSCSPLGKIFSHQKIINKNYSYEIPYQTKIGLIVLPVKINGNVRHLIFDTGADLLVLGKDSQIENKNVNVKVKDSGNKTSIGGLNVIKNIEISDLKYANMVAVKIDLPEPLKCISDGIIGNNIIRMSNFKIDNQRLLVSDHPFVQKDIKQFDCFYYSSNRLFANLVINGVRSDTCLIDYGGTFEIVFPLSYYDMFKNNFKKINSIEKRITTTWGASGKSEPDSTIVVNSDIDFCGLPMDSVCMVFSKQTREKSVGIKLLKRINNVYINNDQMKISFELPINSKNAVFPEPEVYLELEDDHYIVDEIIINEKGKSDIAIGDKFSSINGKKATQFVSFCDFIEWYQDLLSSSARKILVDKEHKEIIIK